MKYMLTTRSNGNFENENFALFLHIGQFLAPTVNPQYPPVVVVIEN